MIQTALEISFVATGCMYTESQIMAKIDFVMTDSTSHNLVVCEEEENEYVLSSLKCNIHPLMKMQRKGKQLFQVIYDKIGINEINKCFMSMLISKVNLIHSKPLDVSHPSLIETFLQNRGIDKNILMPLSIQKNESLSLKDRSFQFNVVHYLVLVGRKMKAQVLC